MFRSNTLLLIAFLIATTYSLSLIEVGSYSISTDDILVRKDGDYFQAFFAFNDEYQLATNIENGITYYNHENKPLKRQKIPFIVLPLPQQMIGDSALLLFSPSERCGGIWNIHETKPNIKFSLNYEFSYQAIAYDETENDIIGFVNMCHVKPRARFCAMRFDLDRKAESYFNVKTTYHLPEDLKKIIDTDFCLGRVLPDGNVIVLLRDSRLLEFDRDGELLRRSAPFANFRYWKIDKMIKEAINYDSFDVFMYHKALPLIKQRYLVAPCERHDGTKSLFIWDIYKMKLIDQIMFSTNLTLLGDRNDTLFFGSLDSNSLKISEQIIDIPNEKEGNISNIMIKNPITLGYKSLAQLIGPIEDKLLLFFTMPGDCAFMTFTNLTPYEEKPEYLKNPVKAVFSHEDLDIIRSYSNSSALKIIDPIYNSLPELTSTFPYAVLIDEDYNVLKEYTKEQIGSDIYELKSK